MEKFNLDQILADPDGEVLGNLEAPVESQGHGYTTPDGASAEGY